MASRAFVAVVGVLSLPFLAGCPVTDDYFIETSSVVSGGSQGIETMFAAAGKLATAGAGGLSAAGSAGVGAGAVETAGSTSTGGGSAGSVGCTPLTERCNGHDDDCDDLVDELACNSMSSGTIGCYGFALPDRADHGYMLCTGTKDYSHAQEACAAQNMRLAWLESYAENRDVAKKVAALSKDAEVLIGATDARQEGEWLWAGSDQFWSGDGTGKAVGGLFSAWMDGAPNDENGDEDCAVLMSSAAAWGDRGCSAKYSYLCEDLPR